MKKIPKNRRLLKLNSFTLIEMLAVVTIIAILAAALAVAGGRAINAAQRVKAANTANQIQTAALGYYTEYSVYPVGTATTDATAAIGDTSASATSWGNLIQVLCNARPYTGQAMNQTAITNSRGVAFMTLKTSDVDTNNAPLNPLPTGTEIYFGIAFDADYSGVVGDTGSASLPQFVPTFSATTGGTSTAGVALWANCNGIATKTNANFYVHTY